MSSTDPAWLALRDKIEQHVALEATSIRLGNRDFVWHRVSNPDVLLESAVASNKELSAAELDPFWAATWRAALGLDRFLDRLDLTDVQVLELGCGSGQAGTGAATRGANVLLTDAVELALQVAELNSWPVSNRVRFTQWFWDASGKINEPYPIILGSDLVYDPSLFPALEHCARLNLASGGRLYLSEPHRHTGDRFSGWIRDAGWQCVEHDIDLQDGRVPVRVFECWL